MANPSPTDDTSSLLRPCFTPSHANISGRRARRHGRRPAHLYLKGNVYYFRFAFNTAQRALAGQWELRLSLRTGYLREAQRLADLLYAKLLMLLEDSNVFAFPIQKAMAKYLRELLEDSPKKEAPMPVIRERLNGYLREILNDEDRNIMPRVGVELEHGEFMSHEDNARLSALANTILINKPDSLENIAPEIIYSLVENEIFTPEEITRENYLQLVNAFLKMQTTANRVIQAREQGDYLQEQVIFSAPYQPVPLSPEEFDSSGVSVPEAQHSRTMLFSELLEKYIETKLADGAWKTHGVADHRNRLSAFLEIMGDREIGSVSRDQMRSFREILRKLPPNRKKFKLYRDKTVAEILDMAPRDTMNVKTVNITVEAVASMFDWAIREGYLTHNPAKSLQIKDERPVIDLREPFTRNDLEKIFSCPLFTVKKEKHPSFYWAPLIGLYTGMRLEEICQLYCADIYQHKDQTWVIDINLKSGDDTANKLLKSKNAARLVPIHQDLITLGLLEYLSATHALNHPRLFPDLNKTTASPKYGKQVGKHFSQLVRQAGVTGTKSFHSLRHTFSQHFKELNLHNDMFRQVFGHSIQELAGKQYGSAFGPKQIMDEIISKLDYRSIISEHIALTLSNT